MMMWLENAKHSADYILKLINEYSKINGYKFNM
jgi:hypothetical protein